MTKRRDAVAMAIYADSGVESALTVKGGALWRTPHTSAPLPHAC